MTKLLAPIASIALAVAASSALAQNASSVTGETKAAMCIGCHNIPGYQASFPEVHKVPKISGQSEKYIVSALQAYKKGDRKHPTMRSVAGSLSDQDMAELAKFYATQPGDGATAAPDKQPEPPADVAKLLQKTNCASCHGANFSKPIDPSYPKIAGQYPDYLYVALKAYQTDKNPMVGRANPIMGGMAKQYTPAELKLIANYIGSLQGEMQTIPQSRFHHASK